MGIPMNELSRGRSATVLGLTAQGAFRNRLLDLGLVPGTSVERVMTSPAGDPVCYRIRGAMIALRSSDAACVRVQD